MILHDHSITCWYGAHTHEIDTQQRHALSLKRKDRTFVLGLAIAMEHQRWETSDLLLLTCSLRSAFARALHSTCEQG